jgi:amino acid adenylation domain-containing protein
MESKPHPLNDLTARMDALSPAKRRLLELRLEKQGALASVEQKIARRATHNSAPLSFTQQQLWFLNQLEPESPAYNQPKAIQLKGQLNAGTLKKALEGIVARHEVLRTTFLSLDGRPVQVIGAAQSIELPIIDLSAVAGEEAEANLHRCIVEVTDRPFDLSHDLMIRAALFRLSENDHVLLLVTHHIASDGWSKGILFRELAALYDAFSAGKPSPLDELPIQYMDFVVWQSEWLQGEVLEQHLSYWRQKLADIPLLELPTDRPRPPVQSYRGARQSLLLPKTLTAGLKALSRREEVTLFMLLLAAFKVLLQRYTGQDDIVVGSPIAGRSRAETEGLIGFFVNTLVLRTDLSGDPSFRELLRRVRDVALGAYAHPDVPFEKLMVDLGLKRTLNRNTLFQVLFALQNFPRESLRLPGLALHPVEIRNHTAKFDLSLYMMEDGEKLRASFEYRTDLFDEATIKRMAGHFETLLEGIVADSECRLSELPVLTAAERQQLLIQWNDTKEDYPKDQCLHQLFEAQVKKTPEAVAVVFESQQLTYRELNARANQLARYLSKRGVGPEVLVGLFMDRSLDMVVALLGILKAGGAYVPLDQKHPEERLVFMLRDARLRVLLTHQKTMEGLPVLSRVKKLDQHDGLLGDGILVCLDTDREVIARCSKENLCSGVAPDNLAYVIYTSGSTGVPKGVMVPHRGICNRLLWGQKAYQLSESDRVLQAFSLSFDFATWEIFTALVAGAQLIIAEPESYQDSAYLVKLIIDHRITLAGFVPSMLRAILDEPEIERCSSLKRVVAGGEVLPVELQERFFARQDAELENTYGPTEASIDVTCWVCKRENDFESKRQVVPIGRPIANTQIYILDSHLHSAPVGVSGELCIGGLGLARGYLNKPDLTAEKFIPNHFSGQPGERIYRTGDLARYLPDGNIEFLGRVDNQVKIRGFRIEPGEIESVLSQHPAVRETVVVVQEAEPGQKRLVAYVASHQEQVPTGSGLRDFLRQKLPDYMIPSVFVFLESLPLTQNGKIDRNALPMPDAARPDLESAYTAPRTVVEETIAGIWAQVLGLEQVGVQDNFFELGGHSLLATQVVSRIRSTFDLELPLRDLFEKPTVAGLAERVETIRWVAHGIAPSCPLSDRVEIEL